jgi:hypothetical protein
MPLSEKLNVICIVNIGSAQREKQPAMLAKMLWSAKFYSKPNEMSADPAG